MPVRRTLFLVALVAMLCAVIASPLQAAVSDGRDDSGAAVSDPLTTAEGIAVDTLDTVRDLLSGEASDAGGPSQPALGTGVPEIDATLALRDLALHKDVLTGSDRAEADAFLARPTDSPGPSNPNPDDSYSVPEAPPACSGTVCVHYVATTSDAPPLVDNGSVGGSVPNGVPDYVDVVLDTTLKARATYLAAGYRAPKGDGAKGGSVNMTDIYLVDIGGANLYGYCPTDQKVPSRGPYDAWAYCVIDNDYSPLQFGRGTPLQNLQVTIAHEFFHVVQFAYDITEDRWLLEATAAWVEDELYDDVNDNLQYLQRSPMRMPRVPMDTFGNSFHYGTWIFIRYLSERFPQAQGGLPVVVRDMIEKTDGSRKGKRNLYSVQAVKAALASQGTDLPSAMALFAAANRRPAQSYDEGKANNYRPAPLAKTLRVGKGQSRGDSITADHLTTATVRFVPKGRLGKQAQLRLSMTMGPANNGLAALASIKLRSGTVRVVPIRISGSGVGAKTVPFSSAVKYVELTMVNAGTSYDCGNGGPYSCRGSSKNDNVKQAYRGTVLGG